MTSYTRRIALKLIALGGTCFGVPRTGKADDKSGVSRTDAQNGSADHATSISWSETHDRVWLDPRIWRTQWRTGGLLMAQRSVKRRVAIAICI